MRLYVETDLMYVIINNKNLKCSNFRTIWSQLLYKANNDYRTFDFVMLKYQKNSVLLTKKLLKKQNGTVLA